MILLVRIMASLVLIAIISFTNAVSQAAPADMKIGSASVQSNGVIHFGGGKLSVAHYDDKWIKTTQAALESSAGLPKQSDDRIELQGEIRPLNSDISLGFQEKIEPVGGGIQVRYDIRHGGSNPRVLVAEFSLPANRFAGKQIRIDDRAVTLPQAFKDVSIVRVNSARRITISTAEGDLQIDGDLNINIQDERKWKSDHYTIRFSFSPVPAAPSSVSLQLQLRLIPFECIAVDIRSQANMGFRDEIPDDQKGGWTDQGPENDLSALKPGAYKSIGIQFNILDPAANGGKSCLVFAGPSRHYLLKTATFELPDQPTWANIFLLHAAAWVPSKQSVVGHITAIYADGTEQVSEVLTGRDVGNWWGPSDRDNGYVGWSYRSAQSDIGLYVSKFPVQNKPLRALRLDTTEKAVWMVAAVTGSPANIELPKRMMKTIVAGDEWAPYELTSEIKPGSIFDFSALADAPAGKYGALRATPQGHFEFESKPGAPVRFWGANLCFSANYLTKQQCEQLADRFLRSGYNTVRLHHYDRELIKKGGRSYELDPVQLDKLDYLFAAFKKRGIYINIDLYTIRNFTKEDVPELGMDLDFQKVKRAMFVSDAVFDVWSRFAKNLLTHVNPYTGVSWAEDPALIGICPVNEDTLSNFPSEPALRRLYQTGFNRWVEAGGVDLSTPAAQASARNRFLLELQIKNDQRLHAFLRSLGVRALLTGANHKSLMAVTFSRSAYDYVDNHTYWDHPTYPEKDWSLPYLYHQASSVRKSASVPREMMPTRVFGRPFAVTEFNFVWPNAYRAESGVLMAAYAGLQDWGALYNFDYASNSYIIWKPERTGITFSLAADPIGLLTDRAGAVIFRRGDVKPAKTGVAYLVSDRGDLGRFPESFTNAGLLVRVGSLPAEQASASLAAQTGIKAWISAKSDDAPKTDLPRLVADDHLLAQLAKANVLSAGAGDGGRFISETGQIELCPNDGTLKLVTDASECFVLPAKTRLEGKSVRVSNGSAFGVVYVLSADGKPVIDTKRMLILFLTDSVSSGMQFAGQDNQLMLTRGALPYLVRRGDAEIQIRRQSKDGVQLWAVGPDGTRLKQIEMMQNGDWLTFKAQTVSGAGTSLAYELVQNELGSER